MTRNIFEIQELIKMAKAKLSKLKLKRKIIYNKKKVEIMRLIL